MNNGHTNPTTAIRKSFVTGQRLESVAVLGRRPSSTEKMDTAYAERDDRASARLMIKRDDPRDPRRRHPTSGCRCPTVYTAWWPWVKNYGGELRAGSERPGPIYARIWIDQDMKKKMGF
jgi:peptide/nickel transport system substrate-binding protein